ncbi:efflux transporter periplasmic adaptor subunit [Rubrivivax gelatinosus]|nr:efflux transporter periplasmic adaptor subunit [Rubrivivax gelatinosus]
MAVLGIALAGGLAWWWQQRGPAPAAAAAPAGAAATTDVAAVEIGRVRRMRLADEAQAVGSLRAAQTVVLRPEVAGRISAFGFRNGERVRRGQLLVQLDDTLQQAQLRQAQAQAQIARTNLARSRELLAQGFISESAVDQNAATLDVAEAQVALARAEAQRMRLVAPFDGTAGIRRVDLGGFVQAGADIVTLDDLSSLSVDFTLPERYLPRLAAGQAVALELDALPGQSFVGRIEALDTQVEAEGRAVLVRARVADAAARLKPGMFARPRVVFAVREDAIVVPEEALVPEGGRQYVWKVVQADGGARAERIEARIGMRRPGVVELLGGVVEGDAVVTAGHGRLHGERPAVRVVELRSGGAAPAAAASAAA